MPTRPNDRAPSLTDAAIRLERDRLLTLARWIKACTLAGRPDHATWHAYELAKRVERDITNTTNEH